MAVIAIIQKADFNPENCTKKKKKKERILGGKQLLICLGNRQTD